MIKIYNISDFSPFYNKEQQFMIAPFESLNRPTQFVWPHKHSFYEILWICEGESKHVVDDHEWKLSADNVYFISPGQVHRIETHSALKGHSIMFTEEFFILNFINNEALDRLAFLRNSYKNPHLTVNAETRASLEPVLQLMYAEFARNDYSRLALGSLMFVLLTGLERVYQSQQGTVITSAHIVLMDQFRYLLESGYAGQRPLGYYAQALHVTPHHLNAVIKKATGKTVTAVISDRIMLEAKRILVHTDTPIGQIAHQLGFNDFSYFSRLFKKRNQLSPDKYRAAMHVKNLPLCV
ncbi:AraC family transcriptional regulator [Mucilaginibacter antarcticus]|uniref:AraC family transcriptional regulator n=1 Tax=Mucilaginibacter antarcticus TaxID=1855725 RepID=A0ABW5XHY7_9SPHI